MEKAFFIQGFRCGLARDPICTGETYKSAGNLLLQGGLLMDPSGLPNLMPRRQYPAQSTSTRTMKSMRRLWRSSLSCR